MNNIFYFIGIATGLILAGTANANVKESTGTLTQIEGVVKIFTHPSKQADGPPPPRALFEGEYYSVRDAKLGDAVENGNIIRTAPGSKVKVIYSNGDQIQVTSETAYRVFLPESQGKGTEAKGAVKPTEFRLMYGKLRGIVEKGGPRSNLSIKTKTAVMGVRGTDFFISDYGNKAGTEVAVLRGAVAVKAKTEENEVSNAKKNIVSQSKTVGSTSPTQVAPAKKEQEVVVAAGMSLEVAKPELTLNKPKADAEPKAQLVLRKTTQEELSYIQKSTQIKPKEETQSQLSQEEKDRLQQLEKKAAQTTLTDIKKTDPKLYESIRGKPNQSTEEINQQVVQKLAQAAPPAPPTQRKPFRSDLEDAGGNEDIYKKFFKEID